MIQIDMPMPESCVECRFSQGGYMYCHAMPENFCGYVNYCEENGRPEWCPLKAQEPRVMTLEEAANAECVFYDWRTRGVQPAKVTRVPYKTGTYRVQRFGDIDEWVHADEYREYWRCWTSHPTDEQREKVKWDG